MTFNHQLNVFECRCRICGEKYESSVPSTVCYRKECNNAAMHSALRESLMVGCERPDGTLNIHPDSETCEVCEPLEVELTAKGEAVLAEIVEIFRAEGAAAERERIARALEAEMAKEDPSSGSPLKQLRFEIQARLVVRLIERLRDGTFPSPGAEPKDGA